MKMYEKLGVGAGKYVTEEDEKTAKHVYANFEAYKREHGDVESLVPLWKFLLLDVEYMRHDAFTWDRGLLVNTPDGKVGMTSGWDKIGMCSSAYAVAVDTAAGTLHYSADKLSKAEIPPGVLEYVKSTLKPVVQAKVNEASNEGGE